MSQQFPNPIQQIQQAAQRQEEQRSQQQDEQKKQTSSSSSRNTYTPAPGSHPPGQVIPGQGGTIGVVPAPVNPTLPPPVPRYSRQEGTGTTQQLVGGGSGYNRPTGETALERQTREHGASDEIDIKIARGYTPEAAIYGYYPGQREDISHAPESVQDLARKGWIITSETKTDYMHTLPQPEFLQNTGILPPGAETQTTYYASRPSTESTFEFVYGTNRADVLTSAAFSKSFMGLGTLGSGIQEYITGDKNVGRAEKQALMEYSLQTQEYKARGNFFGGMTASIFTSPAVQETAMWAGMEIAAPAVISGAGALVSRGGRISEELGNIGSKLSIKVSEFSETLSPTGRTVFESLVGTGKTVIHGAGELKQPLIETGTALGRAAGTKLGQTTIIGDLYLVTEGPRLSTTARQHPEKFGGEVLESAGLWGAMSTSLIGETRTGLAELGTKESDYINKDVILSDVKARTTGQTFTAEDLELRIKTISDDNMAVISRQQSAQDILSNTTPRVTGTGFKATADIMKIGSKEGELLGRADISGVIIGTDKRAMIQYYSGTQRILEPDESIIMGTGLFTPIETSERKVINLVGTKTIKDEESGFMADYLLGKKKMDFSLESHMETTSKESTNKQVFDIYGYDITKKYDEETFISKTLSQTKMRGTGDIIESGSMSIIKTGDVGLVEKDILKTTKKPDVVLVGKGKDYGMFLSDESMTTVPSRMDFEIKEATGKKPGGQIRDFLKDTRSQTWPPTNMGKRTGDIISYKTDEGDFFIQNTLGLDKPTRMASSQTRFKTKNMFTDLIGDEQSGGLPSIIKPESTKRILEPARRDLILTADVSESKEGITVGLQKGESYSPLKDFGKEEKEYGIDVISRGGSKDETAYLLKGKTTVVSPETKVTDILTGKKINVNVPRSGGATILEGEYEPIFDTSYRTINVPLRKLQEMESGLDSSRSWFGVKPQGPIFKTTTRQDTGSMFKTTTILDTTQDHNKDTRDDYFSGTITDFITKQDNERRNDFIDITIQTPIQGNRQDQRQDQMLRQRTDTMTDLIQTSRTTTIETPSYAPPRVPFIPGLPGEQPTSTKRKKRGITGATGYIPEVHEKGRWILLTTKTLTQREATNLLANALDESKAAVGRLKPSRGRLQSLGLNLKDYSQISYKFRQQGDKLIEKREYRMDTPGEERQITAKGWTANRLKGTQTRARAGLSNTNYYGKTNNIRFQNKMKRTNKKIINRRIRYV